MASAEVVYEPEQWPALVETGRRSELKLWLEQNGIDPAVVPINREISIETLRRGRRVIRHTVYLLTADGHKYLDEATGDAAQEECVVPLVTDLPPYWRTRKENTR